MADPGFDRILLPTIGHLLTPQDSLVKSHGMVSRYSLLYCCLPVRVQVTEWKSRSDEAHSLGQSLDGG